MATVQTPAVLRDRSGEIADWVDRHTSGPDTLGEVIGRLTEWTLPENPWRPGELFNPLRGDLDHQGWFWNRAAGNLLDRGQPREAAEVWAAHYLALLSLQLRFTQRYHKGMPLCNLGLAFARAGEIGLAVKSWTIGLIEDALTDPAEAEAALNRQNLLRLRVAPAILGQLVTTVETRFLDQSIVPLFPEAVVEFWLEPTRVGLSEVYSGRVDLLTQRLRDHYPKLPDSSSPWEATLAPSWRFADWVDRVRHGG